MVDDVAIRPARHDDVARMRAIEVAAGVPFRELGMDAVADDPPPPTVVLRGFVERGDAWVLEHRDGEPWPTGSTPSSTAGRTSTRSRWIRHGPATAWAGG